MNDFATKRLKPTAEEYLRASLNQVIERLNNNPCATQSEEAMIQAVITVRAAKINERLAHRLNCLTAIVAIATVCLVAVPFFVPSFEKMQLEARLNTQAQLMDLQQNQLSQLRLAVLKLSDEQGKLIAQVEKQNNAPQPPAQPPRSGR